MTRLAPSPAYGRDLVRHLRVGFVLPWDVVGGGELATLRLAAAVAAHSAAGGCHGTVIEPIAYCAGGRDVVSQLFDRASIRTRTYQPGEFSYRSPLPFLRATVRLAQRFRADRLAVVHGSDLMSAYHAGAAARLAHVPLVCHIRSQFPDPPTRRRKVPIRAIDHFAFVSRATWQHFNTIWPVSDSRGTVIYDWAPPVEATPGLAARARIRASLGVPLGAAVITMVARLAPPKDFDTLLAAMTRLVASHADTHLLLVGDAPDSPEGWRMAES